MRTCHVTPHLPPDQAANALLPAQLGRWAADRGEDVAFVAYEAAQNPSASPGRDLGLPVCWIPRRAKTPTLRRLLKIDAWEEVRQVSAALDRIAGQADLLHLHSNGLIVEAAAAWARRRGVPYVLTLYGTEIWHYRPRWPLDPFTRAYRGAAMVTFYSDGLLARARALGLDRDGMSVVYPPVGEAFRPLDEASRDACRRALGLSERFLVLNVKRLHPLAGQRFLVEAFAHVCRVRQDVRLVICGEGSERESLTRQIDELRLADRVTLTGLLPNETIARYMAAADVFVLPSRLEALPTVAVEALASGTPVISADHPGGVELHALFGDDVTVVPRERVEPLAGALTRFLDHRRRTMPETTARLERTFRPAAVLAAFDLVYRAAARARS